MKRGLSRLMLLAAAALLFGSGFAQDPPGRPQPDGEERRRALADVLRREGLRGAAKLAGNYVQTYDPHYDMVVLDLERLTKNSELAVVGVALRNRCMLGTAGFIVETVYDVQVREVLKGANVQTGDVIKVALPGGKVKFEDGTTAETSTPTFEKMRNGGTYTLYLHARPPEAGALDVRPPAVVYNLTAGPQGLLELAEDGKVRSHARPTDTVARETRDKDASAFLAEARVQALKHPRPGKCCE